MKILTANFLTCAIKTCKQHRDSYPLHFRDVELVTEDLPYNEDFLRGILSRLDWEALQISARELGFDTLPAEKPEIGPRPPTSTSIEEPGTEAMDTDDTSTTKDSASTSTQEPAADTEAETRFLRQLHSLLLETQVQEGLMVCGHCGHQYAIKEGIANFLLPPHLV